MNVNHPVRRNALLALEAIDREEQEREDALRAFYHREKSKPIHPKKWLIIFAKSAIVAFLLWLFITAVFALQVRP